MRKIKTLFALFFVFVISKNVIAQDECPSFKMGKKSIKLRFIPKMKRKEILIKSKSYFNFQESPFSISGKFDNKYDSNFWALGFEKKVSKKASLEFCVGYEFVSRTSFADTLRYDYPTVNMSQYVHSHGKNSDPTADSYDEVISNNVTIGILYRYYFKKVYSGFYIGEEIRASFGINKYIDKDTNFENINYGFKQNNLAFNFSSTIGYQIIAKKHYVFDLFGGILLRQGIDLTKHYTNSNANDEGLRFKYPNTSSLHQKYAPAFITGFAFAYKF